MLVVILAACAAPAVQAEALKSHHTKSLAPRPGGTLKVDAAFHDVAVTLSPGATAVDVVVDVEVSLWPGDAKAALEQLKPVFEETAAGITVRSRTKDKWTFGVSRCSGKIAVTMPPGMALNLDTGSGEVRVTGDTGGKPIACDTGSGGVSIHGRASELKVDTGSGGVTVRLDGPCGDVSLDTGSGGIEFQGAASTFSANTGSGGVRAMGLMGSAKFDTGSGEVEAIWQALPDGAKVVADTGSGGVEFTFPAGASPSGKLETSSGGVQSDFPTACDRRFKDCTLAGKPGGATVVVSAGSGGITLRRAR
jgi:DUF4097 and DUF4098 domain-containing protein YvlB